MLVFIFPIYSEFIIKNSMKFQERNEFLQFEYIKTYKNDISAIDF